MTVTRRLAAILAADVVGYSRLMSEDDAGTLALLRARRINLVEPLIKKYGGRVFKLMGDGLFAEFGSAVSAVEMAAGLQQAMAAANKEQPEGKPVHLRIGVNLGDVLVEGGDLYGDGVNLASRLQELAEPGGICVSAKVFTEVARNLNLSFEDLGERRLKNIAEPVRVYRLDMAAPSPRRPGNTPSLPVKPSIVVLPFLNMSGDSEQEFFADGMTEDVITELSRFKELFVISRNTSFKYKAKSVNVTEVARTLGVQYVIEGSVRKAGGRVRVTVQLIDAETDRHLWAERYDRQLEDIFAIQDEVTSAVVSTLAGRVEAASRERAANKPTENMAAYECLLAGKVLHHRSNPADNARALELLNRAIALDPKYAHAHAWRGCTLGQAWVYNWCADRDATMDEVAEELRIALSLDDHDSDVHRILAALAVTTDDHDKAVYHQQRALSLNPNDDLIVVQQGEILTWLGQPEEGIEWIQKATRLNPYHPERFWNHLGRAYFVAHRYEEAIESFRRIDTLDHSHHAFLAAANAHAGRLDAARSHAREVLKLAPDFSVTQYMTTMHYRQESDRQHHIEGLRRAGLPE
ncbi:adenylate/guanylate cyclase domain-containing protein [Dongia deserti]|uniref:adenylate/guanylate cyclase domain-containing protein n=1 Tax=Dongia deserti TaxID=2268030 RepID=UPI00254820DD|nr:adenylate/guanylate cyclase domain-containing protein [Dongia deserti]